jgi:hypothetical protein
VFSRGGQSHSKQIAVEPGLDHRVDELEQVVDVLETRLDAIESALARQVDDVPPASEVAPDDEGPGEPRLHLLRLDPDDDPEFGPDLMIVAGVDDPVPAVAQDDARLTEAGARIDAAEARQATYDERLGAIAHAVELLALRVEELACQQRTRAGELAPAPVAGGHDTVAAVRELQLAHAKLALEQARIEQLFREDLAELADRIRRMGRPPG